MNFNALTLFLKERLKSEMPDPMAYHLMKPKMADGASFQMGHTAPPKEGGVLILLYEHDETVCFPLIQRTIYKGIHSGQMALPGGRREPSDDGLITTALRETKEEIGVDEKEVEVIGSLSKCYIRSSNYSVLPVIGKVKSPPIFIPDPKEVEDIITPSVCHLINPRRRKEKWMVVRNGFKMFCPYFDLENRVVWGATAMILSELAMILREFDRL